MFHVLIREAGARFGLGDQAEPVTQMLLGYMTQKDTGGLAGFLEKFKAAGLGPVIQSWLGGGPSAQPISNSQLETVLGASGGLLSMITARLGVNRDNVTSAIGYLLPAIVGRLTPGGSLPSSLPAEATALAAAGQALLAAPAPAAAGPAAAGGAMKWLPWLIVAVAALIGLVFWSQQRGSAPAPAPAAAPASQPVPAGTSPSRQGGFGGGKPTEPVATPSAAAPAALPSAPASAVAPAASEPASAGVVSLMAPDQLPALKVYFDSGKTEVHTDFAAKSAELVAYLKAHADVKAVISGFNDPTGNAAANAELARQRAQAVQAALVAQGVAQERTVLEKPADTSSAGGASLAAARRVDVTLRK